MMTHDLVQHLWHSLLTHAQPLGNWCYVLLALLVTVEGPAATLLGAAAAASGLLKPELVFVAAATGNLTADVLWYSLGRLGKMQWMLRHGRWFGLTAAKVEDMERKMRHHAPRIIFVAKLTLFFIIPTLLAAGITRVRWYRWLPIDMLAEAIWTGFLVIAGFYMSRSIGRLEQGIQFLAIVGMAVFFIGLYAVIRRYGLRWTQQPVSD